MMKTKMYAVQLSPTDIRGPYTFWMALQEIRQFHDIPTDWRGDKDTNRAALRDGLDFLADGVGNLLVYNDEKTLAEMIEHH